MSFCVAFCALYQPINGNFVIQTEKSDEQVFTSGWGLISFEYNLVLRLVVLIISPLLGHLYKSVNANTKHLFNF
jgi:ABC-type Fe3+ transport system permease subunit